MATQAASQRSGVGGWVSRLSVTDWVGLALGVLVVLWLVKNVTVSPGESSEDFLIGLTQGSIYAPVALGYTLVYGILELINFAHGDVFMLGAMMAATFLLQVFNLNGSEAVVHWLPLTLVTL